MKDSSVPETVITGIGVISPIGVGREPFWESCRNHRSGIRMVSSFETRDYRSNIAALVEDFKPEAFMAPGVYRRMSRISRMAVASSVEALKDSGLGLRTTDRDRIAVILGTAYGSSSHVHDFYLSLLRDGPRGAQPMLFPETVPNAPASHIAMVHRITGPNSTFSQNEISAECALLFARNLLLRNIADVALVGGAEELSPMLYACHDSLGVLNRVKVEAGKPVVPGPGGGMVLGEGAGTLIMEREDFAFQRGARIYGTLASAVMAGGQAGMGHYETGGRQIRTAIEKALAEAGLGTEDIDQIDVSANFSPELDRLEYEQVTGVFRRAGKKLEVTPLKYLVGDSGGAGILRAAAILISLHRQEPLPTVSAEALIRESCQPLEWRVRSSARARATVMTSSTFGGGSAALTFARREEGRPL